MKAEREEHRGGPGTHQGLCRGDDAGPGEAEELELGRGQGVKGEGGGGRNAFQRESNTQAKLRQLKTFHSDEAQGRCEENKGQKASFGEKTMSLVLDILG